MTSSVTELGLPRRGLLYYMRRARQDISLKLSLLRYYNGVNLVARSVIYTITCVLDSFLGQLYNNRWLAPDYEHMLDIFREDIYEVSNRILSKLSNLDNKSKCAFDNNNSLATLVYSFETLSLNKTQLFVIEQP